MQEENKKEEEAKQHKNRKQTIIKNHQAKKQQYKIRTRKKYELGKHPTRQIKPTISINKSL